MSSGYGFQLIGSEHTGDGDYGNPTAGPDGYGEGPYGGAEYDPVEIPLVKVGSDDPTRSVRRSVGEHQQRRAGVLIGARSFGNYRRWRMIWNNLLVAQVEGLRVFFDARRFYFVPDITDTSARYTVHWTSVDFHPMSNRGNPAIYDLAADLEEVR